MRIIDADELEPDTEWSDYYDGFTSYSQSQIDEAEEEHVDTLVTFSDEINNLKNCDYGILRHLVAWYRSDDQKRSLLSQIGDKTPLVSNPRQRRLDDYTSIYRLHGVAKNRMTNNVLLGSLSEELRRELLRYSATLP